MFGGLQLAGQRGHAVTMRAGVIAPVCQFIARFGDSCCCLDLLLERFFSQSLAFGDPLISGFGLRARIFRHFCRIAPACVEQSCFCNCDLVGECLVTLGLFGLSAQRRNLAVEPCHNVLKTGKIALCLAQFQLGILAPHMKARNACRLFQHFAARCGFGGDNLGDFTLADEGGGVRAGRRIGKGQRDIFCPHIAPVYAVGAARTALDPAGDDQFLSLAILGLQDDFGKIALRAGFGSCEDDIFHPARTHGFGRVFPHYPADRFKQVGFAAAIGADNAGKAGFHAQFGRLDKALKSTELELADLHACLRTLPHLELQPSARLRVAASARALPSSGSRYSARSKGKWVLN